MIHVLNHNSEIIDFISRSDNVVIHSEYKREKENNSELLDLTILSSRAKHFKENNRIIIQDKSNQYREFIIQHIEDSGQYIDVEATASYVIDIGTAKPIPVGKYEKMSVTQKLDEVLRDTDWVTGDCDYGGVRTNSWTSVRTPYEMISQLETSHELESDFEIIIEGNEVVERRVNMKKPNSLFKGKEIEYGKDLTEMKRTVDFSEVVTALFAFGPEDDKGNRISLVVTDDEAQEQFGLPTRYIWGIYEPESDDENMTTDRLKTLARTELNKRKSATVSYEISTIDIEKQFPHEIIRFGDTVRIKNSDFVPSLYAESEVIGFTHDLISDDVVYTFGNVVEYKEDDLLKYFKGKLNEINQKLNDNITNINTIVNDAVAGELEYYERKIFKGAEPPENPQNDTLWYDTSNPDVAVLRRYVNGEWRNETAKDVEQLGGMTREKVLYNSLTNTFANLNIQHSKLLDEVYKLLNNEYLVDDDLRLQLDNATDNVINVYNNIKTNLDSMTPETATIGKLIDTQALFLRYRERLQDLYKAMRNAQIAADDRLKLLQLQYTDKKFDDAMNKIAETLPNGRWDSENQHLYADIPNKEELSNLKQTLQDYYNGNIKELEERLNNSVDSKVNIAKNEISTNVKSIESKVDGLNIGTRNLLLNTEDRSDSIINSTHAYITYFLTQPLEVGEEYTITSEVYATSSEQSGKVSIRGYFPDNGLINVPIIDNKIKLIFKAKVPSERILLYKDIAGQSSYELDTTFKNTILVKGNKIGDYVQAPEDLQRQTQQAQKDAENASKAYADAQDNLKETNIKAYADGIVSDEEKRAIADAIAKRDEAKEYAEQKAKEAQEAANQNTSTQLEPITTRVTSNETNISELDKKISLMAKSEDVAQKLRDVDGRLTPLETDVKNNKATLDILPTQIDSKVSKQDYTLDKNNIVQRLDNADSQRKQLSDEITDKVTITKFESGMTEAKNYTDNIKKETEKYTDNQINNLDIGSENLLLDSEKRSDFSTYTGYSYTRYYLTQPLEIGKIYTLKADIVTTDERQSGKTSVMPYSPNGLRDVVDIKNGKITYTFTAQSESTQFLIYKDVAGQSNVDLNVTIEKAILVEGDKVTSWSPANEDVKKDIQQAETNAKAYTDAYKRNNDIAMTKLETSVSQLDGKVSIKVDEQKFNASQKILSKVLTEIAATTSGIYLSYDNNGTIQGVTVDNSGVKIDATKLDINKGDVVIQNGVTTIKDAYIDKLFSKNATIQYLNSINITAKRLQAIDNETSVNIENGSMTINRNDGHKMDIGIDGISMYNPDGSRRFRMDRTFIESAAIGTSNSNVYLAADIDHEVRTVDISQIPSDGVASSYRYVPIRMLALKSPPNSNAYIGTDGELRIMSEGLGTNGVYRGVRASEINANKISPNNSTNLYVGTDNNVRLVAKNDNNIYRDLVSNGVYSNFIQPNPNTSAVHMYVRSNGVVKFTKNSSTSSYTDIEFANWTAKSSEKFKYDIKEWNYSVLDAFRNDLQLYSYKLNSEKETNYARNHHGIIIEREIPIEWRHGDGFDGNEVMFWNTKAIQELISIVDKQSKQIQKLEEQLNAGSNTN